MKLPHTFDRAEVRSHLRPNGARGIASNDQEAALLARLVISIEALLVELRTARPPSPLLNSDEMAALVGVDARTLRRRELAGDVPAACRIGGVKRWRRVDVDAWIARMRRSAS